LPPRLVAPRGARKKARRSTVVRSLTAAAPADGRLVAVVHARERRVIHQPLRPESMQNVVEVTMALGFEAK
jgi:uncharacterized membrane protein YebE (DUF533 family)